MINTNPAKTIHPVHESDDATPCLVVSLMMPSKMLLFRGPVARDSGVSDAAEHHPIRVMVKTGPRASATAPVFDGQ